MRSNHGLAKRLDRFTDQIYREIDRIEKLNDKVSLLVEAADNIQSKLNNSDARFPANARFLDEVVKSLGGVGWILSGLEEPLQEAIDKLVGAKEALYSID